MWGAAASAEKNLRGCMPARVLGLQEWKSRKFQQVGQQNSQSAGESLPEAGESTSRQNVWTKRNTRQPTTEREGHLLSGSPCSTSNHIKGLNRAPQVIVFGDCSKTTFTRVRLWTLKALCNYYPLHLHAREEMLGEETQFSCKAHCDVIFSIVSLQQNCLYFLV